MVSGVWPQAPRQTSSCCAGVRPTRTNSVIASTRADVRLTMIGGEPLVGDIGMREVFAARRQPFAAAKVDGRARLLARWVAERVARLRLTEPGLELVASW